MHRPARELLLDAPRQLSQSRRLADRFDESAEIGEEAAGIEVCGAPAVARFEQADRIGEQRATSPVRVPLSVNGDRLLDLIALAGAAKSPVYSTNRGSRNEDSTRLKRPRQPPLVERLMTTPVITGPVTVLISVNTFCSSVNGALAT
jgi:hypothetical protein